MPTDDSLRRGAEIALDIETLADAGDGMARLGGLPVFVAGALAGEQVRARVVAVHEAHARAELLEVLRPSPHRVAPRCGVYGRCAGCRVQHADLPTRRAFKLARLRHALRRHLGPSVPDFDLPADEGDGYGERCRLALRPLRGRDGVLRFGLTDLERQIVPIDDCPAARPEAVAVARAIADEASARQLEGLRAFVVHASSDGSQVHATLVADTARLPHAQRLADAARAVGGTGLALNQHDGRQDRMFGRRTTALWGRSFLVDRIGDLPLRLSATTFFEATHRGALGLATAIEEQVGTGSKVIDLYAGHAGFALRLARAGCRVVAVETSIQAVHDADGTAADLGLELRLVNERAEQQVIALERFRPDVVIADPPANGIGDEVAAGIARILTPQRILWVGRDSGTLGRDAGRLCGLGYRVSAVRPVDVDPLARELAAVVTLDRATD
jgi:23S rRNA (uracil1939-C5)-methyltransferase